MTGAFEGLGASEGLMVGGTTVGRGRGSGFGRGGGAGGNVTSAFGTGGARSGTGSGTGSGGVGSGGVGSGGVGSGGVGSGGVGAGGAGSGGARAGGVVSGGVAGSGDRSIRMASGTAVPNAGTARRKVRSAAACRAMTNSRLAVQRIQAWRAGARRCGAAAVVMAGPEPPARPGQPSGSRRCAAYPTSA